MKYFVRSGARTVEVEVDGANVLVDGTPVTATLERVPGTPEVRVTIAGRTAILAVDPLADGRWRLIDAGLIHDLAVEDERHRHIRMLASEGKAVVAGGTLKAPMPGLVVRIAVVEGQNVVAGTPLVVLEAMKMENELKAHIAGRVVAVLVTQGQAVEKGQVLLELE